MHQSIEYSVLEAVGARTCLPRLRDTSWHFFVLQALAGHQRAARGAWAGRAAGIGEARTHQEQRVMQNPYTWCAKRR